MRSNILSSALSASLEDIEDGGEINPVTSETVVELDEVLEEVRESGEVMEGQDDAVETLSDAADSLESLIVALESAVAAGGMSPQTADMHNRGMAIAMRRLPIDKADYTVSVESFGGTADKLVASQEALEGAKAFLEKLWNGIKTAVMNAWNAVKSFFASIGKSGPAVVAAGKSLKAKANATKGTTSESVSISQGVMDSLTTAGNANVNTALAAVVAGYESGVKNYSTRMVSALSPLIAAVNSGAVTPDRLNEAASKVDVEACLTDDMKGKLPGGYFFDVSVGDGDGLAALAKTSLKLNKEKTAGVKEINTDGFKPSDVAALADKVIAIGQSLTSSASVMGIIEKGVNEVVKAGTKLASQGNTLNKEELAGAKAVMAQLNKASRLITGCGPQYLSYMGTTAKAAISFGNSILKSYK